MWILVVDNRTTCGQLAVADGSMSVASVRMGGMNAPLLSGRGLLESVRVRDNRLYVSDWSAGEILDATADEVLATVPSLPLCFDWFPDGDIVIVDSTNRKLLRRKENGALTTAAELPDGVWNDITVNHNGDVYVNGARQLGEPGTIHRVRGTTVTQVADDLAFPNGMTIIDDTLIVAESHAHRLTAYDITADGLANRHTWAELDDKAAPDGISHDNGTIWYADVPNKKCAQVTQNGEVRDHFTFDRGAFDCVATEDTVYVATAEWRGMTELVTPGSGQLLGIPRNSSRSAGASIRSTGRNVTSERT
jgi:sugar lactone lactonase YvrE